MLARTPSITHVSNYFHGGDNANSQRLQTAVSACGDTLVQRQAFVTRRAYYLFSACLLLYGVHRYSLRDYLSPCPTGDVAFCVSIFFRRSYRLHIEVTYNTSMATLERRCASANNDDTKASTGPTPHTASPITDVCGKRFHSHYHRAGSHHYMYSLPAPLRDDYRIYTYIYRGTIPTYGRASFCIGVCISSNSQRPQPSHYVLPGEGSGRSTSCSS